jgi:nucleoside-diphosphate-sugar epimerase
LLIIGCGDVVRRALPHLLRHWRIYALVRHRDPGLAAMGIVQLPGDLDCPRTLKRISGIAHAVLHSAPPPDRGSTDSRTRRLIAALRRGESLPRSLTYIGTSGVYGDCSGAIVSETRRLAPRSPRGQRRADAEAQLRRFGRSSGCRVSLLRAPGIYAADRMPTERLRRGLPLLRPEDDVHTNHIHAEDLASLCIRALHRGRPQRAYNASDDLPLPMGDWFDKLADAWGLPRAPRLPRGQVEAALTEMQRSFMRESRRLDNTRIKRELMPRLRYPTVDDGLRAALLSQPSRSDSPPSRPAPEQGEGRGTKHALG